MSETVLEEAQRLVYGERQKEYGSPAASYSRIATMFSTLTGKEITAAEAATFMILVKLDREQHQAKRDNRVDGAGYFGVLDLIRQREADIARLEELEEENIKGDLKVKTGTFYPWRVFEVDAACRPVHPPEGQKRPSRPDIDNPRRHG